MAQLEGVDDRDAALKLKGREVAVPRESLPAPEDGSFDAMHPGNVSPFVVWLGSTQSAHVTGLVFEVEAGKIAVADGWRHGEAIDKGARWDPSEIGTVVDRLLVAALPPAPVYGA